MREQSGFESILEQRLRANAARMQPTTDTRDIARQAVLAKRQLVSIRWPLDRRWVLLAAALLLGAAAAIAVAGAVNTRQTLLPGSIVFTTADGLWVADSTGSNRRLLLAGDRFQEPVVSPDGRNSVLRHYDPSVDPGVNELLVVDVAGETVGRWAAESGVPAQWVSAQGGPLILTDDLDSWNLVTPSGTVTFRLARTDDGASWSPEGSLPVGLSSLFYQGSPTS